MAGVLGRRHDPPIAIQLGPLSFMDTGVPSNGSRLSARSLFLGRARFW